MVVEFPKNMDVIYSAKKIGDSFRIMVDCKGSRPVLFDSKKYTEEAAVYMANALNAKQYEIEQGKK